MKRSFAIILALALLAACLPLGVWATEASSPFALELKVIPHTQAETVKLGLYLSADRPAQVGSFQFRLSAAVSDYEGYGSLGQNQVAAFVAENAAGIIEINSPVLLASFCVSGDYESGTTLTLTEVEVNEWGADAPSTAAVTYSNGDIHTYENGKCAVCEEPTPLKINSAGLVLNGIPNLKITPEGNLTVTALDVTIGQDTTTLRLAPDPDGRFTLQLPAHRLGEPVKLTLLSGTRTLDTRTWTLAEYANGLKTDPDYGSNTKMMTLVDALCNYSAYAAYYADPTGTKPSSAPVEAVDRSHLEDFKSTGVVCTDPALHPVAALYLDDACDLVFKFDAAAWGAGYQLYIGEDQADVSQIGSQMVCRKEALLPQQWQTLYTVTVKDASDAMVFGVDYSVLSYAYNHLSKVQEAQAELSDLLRAMYLYSLAATNYTA